MSYVKYSFSFLGYRPPIFPPGQFLFERGVNMVFSPLHPENDLFIREKRYNYLIKPNEQHARINRINQRKKYYRPWKSSIIFRYFNGNCKKLG